jgi:hypothetical protein
VERRKVQRILPETKKKKIKCKPRPDDDYYYHSFGRTLKRAPGAPFELRKQWNKAHNGDDFWRWTKEDSVSENMSCVDVWKVDMDDMEKGIDVIAGGVPNPPQVMSCLRGE